MAPPYKKHILLRDGKMCFLCGSKKMLHVHHIVFRSQGGKNNYENLVTLCGDIDHGCHSKKAHGPESSKYRDLFLEYTSTFPVPDFWDAIMKESEEYEAKKNEKRKKYQSSRYEDMKKSSFYKNEKKKKNDAQKEAAKGRYRKKIEYFKSQHGGLTPWQYEYRRKKGLK